MASSGVTHCPRTVHVVVLPDKAEFPEPVAFYREDQADRLVKDVPGAEAFTVPLHMWLDGEATVARLRTLAAKPSNWVYLQISREGAESFVSDSAGWGAMGLQEIHEAIQRELSKGGE